MSPSPTQHKSLSKKMPEAPTLSLALWQKALFWGTTGLLLMWLLMSVKTILAPFIIGLVVAYAFAPLVARLATWRVPRPMAALGVVVVILGILISFVVLTWPFLQSQIIDLANKLPTYSNTVQQEINREFEVLSSLLGEGTSQKIKLHVANSLNSIFLWFGSMLVSFVTSGVALVNFLVLLIISPIVAFYLLRDWPKLVKTVRAIIPTDYLEVVEKQATLMDQSLRGYARGQVLVSLILSFYYGLALWLSGLEYGAVIGMVTGFLTFIPYLAVFSGFLVSCLMALYQSPDSLFLLSLVISLFIVGQLLEGSLLTPNLIGNRIGLHPVWIIFVVLSGATLFGFWGAILALPVASLLSVITKFCLEVYYASPFHGSRRNSPDPASPASPANPASPAIPDSTTSET